ncbi:MAG: TIGR02147 family protein [Bdellovibrionales bacterium]
MSKQSDFRLYLQEELVRRIKKNQRYSLRAFAELLETHSGSLSQVLAGKRKLSVKKIEDWSYKLGLDPQTAESFKKESLRREIPGVDTVDLEIEEFYLIQDWYHFAILELVNTQGFSAKPAWIAKRLGIKVVEAKIAIERLMRLNFLSLDKKGNYRVINSNVSTLGSKESDVALRNLQKKILNQAQDALDEIDPRKRLQTTITSRVKKDKLEEVKQKILDFQQELNVYLEEQENCEEVYQISFSCFPVTK